MLVLIGRGSKLLPQLLSVIVLLFACSQAFSFHSSTSLTPTPILPMHMHMHMHMHQSRAKTLFSSTSTSPSPSRHTLSASLQNNPNHKPVLEQPVAASQPKGVRLSLSNVPQLLKRYAPRPAVGVAVTLAATALTMIAPAFASQSSALSSVAAPIIDRLSGSGFFQAFSLIFVSEIGDKTFFIAGLLAMRSSKALAFVGSMAALGVMTIISVAIGQIFHAVPASFSRGIPYDDYLAVAAFAYFGVKTLRQAYEMQDDGAGIEEEKAEAEREVTGAGRKANLATPWALLVQAFTLVFAAEIGDRSFLSTIALSAALNPFSVAAGAIAAHAAATGIAVTGGAFMSRFLSERTMGYIGGSLFIIFAFTTAVGLF